MAVKASATITLTQYRDTQSVTRYYKLQPAGSSAPLKPETKPPSSDWTDSEPACDISKELYFCDLTIFSNGEGEYSTVSKSTSYEAAKQAYNKAQSASDTASAAKDSIDNLEVGGRNLLRLAAWGRYRGSKWYEDIINVTNEGYTFTATGDPSDLIGFKVPVESGVITISGKTGLVSQTIYFTVYGSSGDIVQAQSNSNITTENGRFVLTLTMPSGASELHIGFGYYPYSSASGDYTVSNLKLEKGNKATDWTPAPEDVDADIDDAWEKADNAQTSIDNLEIGGRNLFLNTGKTVSNNNYKISEYAPANGPLKAGETYTATICVTPAENLTQIRVYFSLGFITPVRFFPKGTGKQVISGTFTMRYYDGKTPDVHPSYAYAELYRFPEDGTVTGNTTIHWFKIEKGNKATDWTPAPEDIDSRTTVLEAASAKELVRNGFAEFTNDPKLTLGKTTSPWKVVVKNDGIFLQKSSNDVASLSKETSSEETTLRADNARLANVKFRSANGGGKLGIVAQSNGHVSLKEI